MRCKNCGWENRAEASKCEKCNAPLNRDNDVHRQITSSVHEYTPNISQTVREVDVFDGQGNKNVQGENSCPKCDYPVIKSMNYCPQCNNPLHVVKEPKAGLKHEPKSAPNSKPYRDGTVNPWDQQRQKASCSLQLIPDEAETIPLPILPFSGNRISLNRDNIESGNMTITSKEQAVLTFENDKWYIQDYSSQKTTFVLAHEKVELKSGDVILMGDRRFEFKV